MKIFFLIVCVIWSGYTQAQNSNENIVGRYKYNDREAICNLLLELRSDLIYNYIDAGDLGRFKSSGKWKCYGDTIYLNSKFSNLSIPLEVEETKSLTDSIIFDFIEKVPDSIIAGIHLDFGKEQGNIDIISGQRYSTSRKRLKSFDLYFGEKLVSQTYFVKDFDCNYFKIKIDLSGIYHDYLVFDNKKNAI